MNFTREPIIETIITPKEGYRLIVRNSKGASQEEHSVDALEIVSFGPAIFYRSLEKPKPFLVPIADFEVVEIKETRVILKNVNLERSIKIGGGREPVKQPREQISTEETPSVAPAEYQADKKRERRHKRRRRGDRSESREEKRHEESGLSDNIQTSAEEAGEGGGIRDEAQVSSPTFTTLFPPPTTLISQTIARYKDYKDQAVSEGALPAQPVKEKPEEKKKEELSEEKKKEESDTEISELNRVSTSNPPFSSDFHTT